MASMVNQHRDQRGRFSKSSVKKKKKTKTHIQIEHNYSSGHLCEGNACVNATCALHDPIPPTASREGWQFGRRIVELDHLLSSLKSCSKCRLGPVPLTYFNIVGELKKGLSGYIYVKCTNSDCGAVNRVPYGKTHRKKSTRGMPSFAVNTKLGTGNL